MKNSNRTLILLLNTPGKPQWAKKVNYFGPCHTNADSIIHFEHANIAPIDDLHFNRRPSIIDRSTGVTISTFFDDTIFVFDHPLDLQKITGNKEDLKAFQNYLDKVLTFAEAEFKAGKSKEEFIKNRSIPGETEWKGDGIERPLTAAYEEVSNK